MIEQGYFYNITWHKTGKKDIIESKNKLRVHSYFYKNNQPFFVNSEIKFKYTFEDIDNIRVMMEGYDPGTVQDRLRARMAKAFHGKTPSVRFTFEEREILSYVYYENVNISEKEKATLRKVLGIPSNGRR